MSKVSHFQTNKRTKFRQSVQYFLFLTNGVPSGRFFLRLASSSYGHPVAMKGCFGPAVHTSCPRSIACAKDSNIPDRKRLYLRRNYKKNHTYGGDIGDTSAVSMLKKVVTAVLSSTARRPKRIFQDSTPRFLGNFSVIRDFCIIFHCSICNHKRYAPQSHASPVCYSELET